MDLKALCNAFFSVLATEVKQAQCLIVIIPSTYAMKVVMFSKYVMVNYEYVMKIGYPCQDNLPLRNVMLPLSH